MAETTPKVSCPTCQKQFAFKPELAGRKVKCPKCGNGFVVTPPGGGGAGAMPAAKAPAAADEYDLAPEAPRTAEKPRYEVQHVEPVKAGKTFPTTGQEAKSILATTARLGARHGVVGLVGGLVGGGLFMVIRRKPRILLYIFFAVAGLFFMCLGSGWILHWVTGMRHQAAAPPALPPAFVPQPAFVTPVRQVVNYDTLVQRFGVEHVFRIRATGSTNVPRDMKGLQAMVGTLGGSNWTASANAGTLEISFGTDRSFDACVEAVKAMPGYNVTTVDTEQRIVTVSILGN